MKSWFKVRPRRQWPKDREAHIYTKRNRENRLWPVAGTRLIQLIIKIHSRIEQWKLWSNVTLYIYMITSSAKIVILSWYKHLYVCVALLLAIDVSTCITSTLRGQTIVCQPECVHTASICMVKYWLALEETERHRLCVSPMWMWSPIQPNTCECFIYFPHTNDSISGIQTIHILIFKSMPTSFLPWVRTSFFIHFFPYPRLCPDICYSFFLSCWPRSF